LAEPTAFGGSFDPAAGEVDVFPQGITRALLNLISNGFYAATKRKDQDKSERYEPTLNATTKNFGDSVEIRIRDNGIGIQPEVKEKMFNRSSRPNPLEKALAWACRSLTTLS
jgi:signal transduction histidine kinase